MSGIKIKVTIVSKSGPPWEQELLSQHKQKIMLSMPREATLDALKDKICDKFIASNLAELNGYTGFLQSCGIERISTARISNLFTRDGYDIDEDSSLADLFGSYGGIELEVQAEVDLVAVPLAPAPECCVIS